MPTNHPILFFDGHCNLCNGAVQWFLKRDKKEVLRFASLQSDLAKQLLPTAGVNPEELSSLVLYNDGKAHTHSAGALRTGELLGGIYAPLGKAGLLFPRFLRDGVYDFIARNRYRWFGRSEVCWLPQPEWKARFVD